MVAPSVQRNGRFIARRLVAAGIDGILIVPVSLSVLWLGAPERTGPWLVGMAASAVLDWVGVAFFGATPGKALVGLRVRSITTEPIGLRRAAVRTAVSSTTSLVSLAASALSLVVPLDPGSAFATVLGFASLLVFMYIYSPVLGAGDGRGRHDRAAGSDVIAVRGTDPQEHLAAVARGLQRQR